MERGKAHTGLRWGDLREGDHLEYLGIDERIILKRIFKKWGKESSGGFFWFRIGTGAEFCECGNEPSGSIKCGNFLTS